MHINLVSQLEAVWRTCGDVTGGTMELTLLLGPTDEVMIVQRLSQQCGLGKFNVTGCTHHYVLCMN